MHVVAPGDGGEDLPHEGAALEGARGLGGARAGSDARARVPRQEYRAKEAKAGKNTEADAAWRMMGVVGGAGAVGLYVASKNAKGTDKKLVNGAIAAQSIGAAAIFAGHPCMNNDVKPELKNLNLIANLGLGAYALKKALE